MAGWVPEVSNLVQWGWAEEIATHGEEKLRGLSRWQETHDLTLTHK